jgi:AcrR family transcriptional regulator
VTKSLAKQLSEKRADMMVLELESIALKLFEERGYGPVTVEDIAAQAGIATRTFYRYFPGKEDLLQVRLQRRAEWFRSALWSRPDDEPPVQSLRIVFGAPMSAEEEEQTRRWIGVVSTTPAPLLSVLGGVHLHIHGALAEFFGSRLGMEADSLVPTMLAAAAGGVLQAASSQWFQHGGDLPTIQAESLHVLEEGTRTDWASLRLTNGNQPARARKR